MTSEQIAELRKLEAAASPGPWRPLVDERGVTVYPPDGVAWGWLYDANGKDVVTWGHDEGGVERREDGQVIVAARNALTRLLDEREALLEALTGLENWVTRNVWADFSTDAPPRQIEALAVARRVLDRVCSP